MALTLGLTGMDQVTEAALRTAFTDANDRVGRWMLVNESDADYVIVDMDSMYGPMSWLRLHAAGKRVIGLTTAPRTQADFRLTRPLDIQQMTQLLGDIAGTSSAPQATAAATSASAIPGNPATTVAAPTAAAPTSPAPVVVQSAPAPPKPIVASAPAYDAAQATASPTAPAKATAAVPAPPPAPQQPTAPPLAPPSTVAPAPTVVTAPAAVGVSTPQPAVAAPSTGSGFADWLRPGALSGRARFQRLGGSELFIDFVQRQYYGPATLKPLTEYFSGEAGLREFEQLDDATWQLAVAKHGSAQPLSRLQWLGGLLAGQGQLLPGLDPAGKFILNKWPQTEREYPKHFRIATAMMKGPQTVAEIAAASGSPEADVADFINANLATGFAEPAGGAANLGLRGTR
jgi:hypothetical protein